MSAAVIALIRCPGGCNATKRGGDNAAAYPSPADRRVCKTFVCARCKLPRPWCCGGADDQGDVCDACYESRPS